MKFIAWLSRSEKHQVYWLQFACAIAVVWGFALLPGGLTVGAVGMIASLGVYFYRHLHRTVQLMLLPAVSVPPLERPSARYRRAMRIVLLFLVLTLFDVPAQIVGTRSAPTAIRAFNIEPMNSFPRRNRWTGVTFAREIDASVSGVTIIVLGGGGFHYDVNGKEYRMISPLIGRKVIYLIAGWNDQYNYQSFFWRDLFK